MLFSFFPASGQSLCSDGQWQYWLHWLGPLHPQGLLTSFLTPATTQFSTRIFWDLMHERSCVALPLQFWLMVCVSWPMLLVSETKDHVSLLMLDTEGKWLASMSYRWTQTYTTDLLNPRECQMFDVAVQQKKLINNKIISHGILDSNWFSHFRFSQEFWGVWISLWGLVRW